MPLQGNQLISILVWVATAPSSLQSSQACSGLQINISGASGGVCYNFHNVPREKKKKQAVLPCRRSILHLGMSSLRSQQSGSPVCWLFSTIYVAYLKQVSQSPLFLVRLLLYLFLKAFLPLHGFSLLVMVSPTHSLSFPFLGTSGRCI